MITEFIGNLFCPPEPGHAFVISGKSTDAAMQLDFDFLASKAPDANCHLKVSVHFHKDWIVRNSCFDGNWGEPEIKENLDELAIPRPLEPGKRFRLQILVTEDRFLIGFNDIHYCSYKFRGRLSDIRTLKIHKDVQYVNQVDHRTCYPSPRPLIQYNEDHHSFSNDVPKKFMPGHAMIISAIPYGNPKGRFTIYFFENETKKQALHFNARFDQQIVVRNSTNDKLSFREEETSGEFPFVFDQQFKLAIALSTTHFLIAIDGRRFCMYKYRTQNQFDSLNGFKIYCLDQLRLEVATVDHIYTGSPSCQEFETFSNPDLQLY
uniref:Galectin n=1 Tax=Culicoides sonorensis TaxID=179676 RepID=A0A336LTS2_CULSO